jgi:hypothetical protein
VPLLLDAAERGHCGARQHIRQLLDGKFKGFSKPNGEVPQDRQPLDRYAYWGIRSPFYRWNAA